jgi:hypothetical protein
MLPQLKFPIYLRYVYNTRLMQSEAVGYAYAVWRRKWGGRGKEYVRPCSFIYILLCASTKH